VCVRARACLPQPHIGRPGEQRAAIGARRQAAHLTLGDELIPPAIGLRARSTTTASQLPEGLQGVEGGCTHAKHRLGPIDERCRFGALVGCGPGRRLGLWGQQVVGRKSGDLWWPRLWAGWVVDVAVGVHHRAVDLAAVGHVGADRGGRWA
jgi:hypothetical protein